MKTYAGVRTPEACIVTVSNGAKSRRLPLRLDLDNHSPTGFEWGYGGSGPAQLALALLADALGDGEKALRLHQEFKFRIVAGLPKDFWYMTDEQVRAVADTMEGV